MAHFLEDIFRRVAELERRQNNLLRVGTVHSVDAVSLTCRVKIGKILTAPLQWLTPRAGANAQTYAAPSVGEQVLVLSPSGELVCGVVLPALNSLEFPGPIGDSNIDRKIYPDGTDITYDYKAHLLSAVVAGDVDINVSGNVEAVVQGNVEASIGGNLKTEVAGNVDATVAGDVSASVTGNVDATVTGQTNAVLIGSATITANAPLSVVASSTIAISAAAAVTLTATSVAITAPAIALTGNLNVTGNIVASGTVSAGNPPVSLTTHTHSRQAPPDAPS